MLAFLAISFAAIAVNAQYGSNTANDAPSYQQPSYSNGPIYYPPVVYDSHFYWDYDSREHHTKRCPRIQTYLPTLPGFPEATFYPPVIRYAKFNGRLTALIVCDRDPKNINVLVVRRNETRDVRAAYAAAAGTTAGMVANCDRRDNRFTGPIISNTSTFVTEVPVREVACIGLDELPIVGLLVDKVITYAGAGLAIGLNNGTIDIDALGRKKRDTAAEATTAAAAVVTDAAAAVTEAASEPTANLSAAQVAVASIDLSDGLSEEEAALIKDPKTAIQVGLAGIGKVLGSVL